MKYLTTKDITIAAVLAALYAILVFTFNPISFLVFQIRIANVLIGLVPILGLPAVIGISLGVLVANVFSPLGFIDLISSFFSFISLYIIWKLRRVSVFLGLSIYSVILGAWVSFMISYVFNVSYLPTFVYVTIGIFIATSVLGYLLYKAVEKIIPKGWRR